MSDFDKQEYLTSLCDYGVPYINIKVRQLIMKNKDNIIKELSNDFNISKEDALEIFKTWELVEEKLNYIK
tara:strand:- start:1102 stop:1311 length:210 start_codon:yes stop_codon:yes gene_type:complete